MKRKRNKTLKSMVSQEAVDSDILPEYDFKDGIRGKHFKAYRQGHTVKIHKVDGTTAVQYFKLEDGAVMLEPDVREYFPDSETVNKALRSLIELIPVKRFACQAKFRAPAICKKY